MIYIYYLGFIHVYSSVSLLPNFSKEKKADFPYLAFIEIDTRCSRFFRIGGLGSLVQNEAGGAITFRPFPSYRA